MDGPRVRISTRVGAHESSTSVIDAIKNLFPDFVCENELKDSTFPRDKSWIELQGEGGSMNTFLQALRDQRILDTGMDAMTMDSTNHSTLFRLSRQAAIVGKVGFILEGEASFGGHFEVMLEDNNLLEWIEKSTFHEGRNHVPRSVGDGYGMEMDGTSREWNEKD